MRVPLAPPTRESNRGSGVVQNLRSIETLPQYGSDAGCFRVLVTIVYHGISHTTLAEHKNSVSALKQVNCGYVLTSVADGGPSPLCDPLLIPGRAEPETCLKLAGERRLPPQEESPESLGVRETEKPGGRWRPPPCSPDKDQRLLDTSLPKGAKK